VLCAVDFSAPSRIALRHAAAIAVRTGATLIVLYANDPLLVAAAAAALHDRSFARRSQSELERFVASTLSAGSRRAVAVTAVVVTARPTNAILEAAATCRADLIVLGTHGLTGADRMLLGSTTHAILHQSVIPVLAIPRASRRGPTRGWPGRRVAAALEVDSESAAEARSAVDTARQLDASLTFVHVVKPLARPPWLNENLDAQDRLHVEACEAQLHALVKRLGPAMKCRVRVLLGHAPHELAAFATSGKFGLIITTRREKQGWLGARRGSISYDLLSRATTPVLALPPARGTR
jgi:nucleotide-binding universal stress UspA family protein